MAERAKYAVATLRRRPRGGDFSRACCAFNTRVTIVVGAHSFASYDVSSASVPSSSTPPPPSSLQACSSSASRSAGVPLDVQF